MVSKQRSFFDQKKPAARKPYRKWPSNNKAPQLPPQGTDAPKKTMSVPLAASTASRKKLKAFEFTGNAGPVALSMDENDKENPPVRKSQQGDPKHEKSPKQPLSSATRTGENDSKAVLGYPQTPVGRVPLQELINNDGSLLEAIPNISPIERVVWNGSPQTSTQMASILTPALRRGKRKRKSSEPASSQLQASNHFAMEGGRALAEGNTQALLKTPQADPVRELWLRYSIDGPEKTPITSAAVARFLNSSSPRSNDCERNLKRSLTCGSGWPTPATKRRRIDKTLTQINFNYSRDFRDVLEERDEAARCRERLIQKINQSFSIPMAQLRDDAPGSSPTVSNEDPNHHLQDSPLQRLNTGLVGPSSPIQIGSLPLDDRLVQSFSQTEVSALHPESAAVDRENSPEKESFSEFGAEELEYDMLEEATSKVPTSVGGNNARDNARPESLSRDVQSRGRERYDVQQAKSIPMPYDQGATSVSQRNESQHPPLKKTSKAAGPLLDAEEEYDFGDDDEFLDAELEAVVASYDLRPPRAAPHGRPRDAGGEVGQLQLASSHPLSKVAHDGRDHEPALEAVERVTHEISSDDEFGADSDFEELANVYTQDAAQGKGASSDANSHPSTIQRYLVLSVVESDFVCEKGVKRREKVLRVEEEATKRQRAVTLRQSWVETACTVGSYIHVLGAFDEAGQCVIDNERNMLILHPDHLISATVVADSFSCIRRAVLQERVKATNDANASQVYGHILHAVFQEAMRANRWDTEWLTTIVQSIASKYLETLFEINLNMGEAVAHLMSKMPELQSWAELFVTAHPKKDAIVKDRNGSHALMSVTKLLDVEEHVWSPMYGLKGNIDATVQVTMQDGRDLKRLTVPLELKTGKGNMNANHKAQTALYTLLLSDRYDVQIAYGILYYMETSEISRIPGIRNEIRGMIIQRNEVACYVRQRLELPPMLKSPHLCGKCFAKTTCFTYHKLVDDGDGQTSGMKEKFDELVGHLKPIHQEFFVKWDNLLTKEESDLVKFKRELWTMTSIERERAQRCFSHVVIEPGSAFEMPEASKINRFRYVLIKQHSSPGFSFNESQITIGEPIVISDEKGHFALANGYVTNIRRKRITVAVDRRLHNARVKSRNFDAETNQSFAGIMEVTKDGAQSVSSTALEPEETVLYRLDKDEFSSGMATVRNNLIRIMQQGTFGAAALRSLIIEDRAPRFAPTIKSSFLATSASQATLNVDQRAAVKKVLSAKDYALVLGMPGTGKTTTIAHLIRALISDGKSILLTSYTHSAVDNILLKVRAAEGDKSPAILRLGAVAKIHPEVQAFADLADLPKTDVEELKRSYAADIVATTCLGINHPIFNQRVFDYCIVDEASQITLPVCLGPICMARTFVLVGDHNQLTPLVRNREAQEGGLDVSLFQLLSDRHPESVVNLEHQYRMCEDIMSLSNTLIYGGKLKCGTKEVAERVINIPNMDALKIHHFRSNNALLSPSQALMPSKPCVSPSSQTCFLARLLSPSVRVSFVNTDPLLPASSEIARGARITNPVEAALTAQLVESLITVGVPPTEIGVITLYRSQLALIRQNLRHRIGGSSNGDNHDADGAVEVQTTDRFQGRDKEVIILSLVRSNDGGNVGDLLKDWRRVNVALTRARTKLLIIGSRETMAKGSELLGKFVALVEGRGWREDLVPGCLDAHFFDGLAPTPGSALAAGEGEAKGDVRDKREREAKERMEVWVDGKGDGATVKPEEGHAVAKPKVQRQSRDEENAAPWGRSKTRLPGKVAGVDATALVGKRPVLRDIANALGGLP